MAETSAERRRGALRRFMDAQGLRPATWARQAGVSEGTLRNFLAGRSDSLSQATLEKLAAARGVSAAALITGEPSPEVASKIDLPQDVEVHGTVAGAIAGAFQLDTGTVVDRVHRPPGLLGAAGLYALYVRGDSMAPKFEEGDLIYIHPHRPPAPGCYVVVQIQAGANLPIEAYIKRLARRTASKLILEQINPLATIEIPAKHVVAVHRILTINELFGV